MLFLMSPWFQNALLLVLIPSLGLQQGKEADSLKNCQISDKEG